MIEEDMEDIHSQIEKEMSSILGHDRKKDPYRTVKK